MVEVHKWEYGCCHGDGRPRAGHIAVGGWSAVVTGLLILGEAGVSSYIEYCLQNFRLRRGTKRGLGRAGFIDINGSSFSFRRLSLRSTYRLLVLTDRYDWIKGCDSIARWYCTRRSCFSAGQLRLGPFAYYILVYFCYYFNLTKLVATIRLIFISGVYISWIYRWLAGAWLVSIDYP